MSELTEKGTLPVGITVAGKVHKEYEIRPEVLGDTMEGEDQGHGGAGKEVTMSAFVLSRRIVKLGTLESHEITMNLLKDMDPADYAELMAGSGRLAKKRESFRAKKSKPGEGDSGAA